MIFCILFSAAELQYNFRKKKKNSIQVFEHSLRIAKEQIGQMAKQKNRTHYTNDNT